MVLITARRKTVKAENSTIHGPCSASGVVMYHYYWLRLSFISSLWNTFFWLMLISLPQIWFGCQALLSYRLSNGALIVKRRGTG